MKLQLQQLLDDCSAHRKSREAVRDLIFKDSEYFAELVKLAFDVYYKYHFKACWIIELVAAEKPVWLHEHLSFICGHLQDLKNQSGIRPIAKVILQLVDSNFKKKTKNLIFTDNHLEKITEVCFDWLISDTKVAAKAYAMITLFHLGKKYDWIHPELNTIIEKDYHAQSPAYKATAREILKKINKKNLAFQ